MLFALGFVAYWASLSLVDAADKASQGLNLSRQFTSAAYWAVKQYQNQADLILGRDPGLAADFERSSANFSRALGSADRAGLEEQDRAVIKKLAEAEKSFTGIFRDEVVAEMSYQLKGVLRGWTASPTPWCANWRDSAGKSPKASAAAWLLRRGPANTERSRKRRIRFWPYIPCFIGP